MALTGGDISIAYDDRGSGEPALLFMPGWCAGQSTFDDLVGMTNGRRTLAMDWRGHGGSAAAPGDFGTPELVEDALAVIDASGAETIVPVAAAHAGWVAIELRRRLGERIPKVVLIDWIVTEAPPAFLAGCRAMTDPAQAFAVRDQLFATWTSGVDHSGVHRFVRDDMGDYPEEMWARAGREIGAAYGREGSPLQALAALAPRSRCSTPTRSPKMRRTSRRSAPSRRRTPGSRCTSSTRARTSRQSRCPIRWRP